jgi:hypothetical protein
MTNKFAELLSMMIGIVGESKAEPSIERKTSANEIEMKCPNGLKRRNVI